MTSGTATPNEALRVALQDATDVTASHYEVLLPEIKVKKDFVYFGKLIYILKIFQHWFNQLSAIVALI